MIDPAPVRRGSLQVPSSAPMLSTVRVFVGSFVSRFAHEESTEDVRLAVSEACGDPGDGSLRVVLDIGEDRCTVTCEGVRRPADDEAGIMRMRLLRALAPDADWFREDAVRFSLPISD